MERLSGQRDTHKKARLELRTAQREELASVRAQASPADRFAAVSVAKMQHAVQLGQLAEQFRFERKELYQELNSQGPGTYKTFLAREAQKGDNSALQALRRYGEEAATALIKEQEATQLRIRAAFSGNQLNPVTRLPFSHHIQPSGTVVYQMGGNRQISDSAISHRIELNDVAANDREAIATALRFSTLRFGQDLVLTGSDEFKMLAVEISVNERMGVRFTDPALEAYSNKLLEQQSAMRGKQYASNNKSIHARQIPSALIRDRLLHMPARDLVLDTSRADDRRPAGADSGAGDAGQQQIPVTAQEWAEQFAQKSGKAIRKAVANSRVTLTVLHIGAEADGVVLDMGRSIAVFPARLASGIEVGSKVTVSRDGLIRLQVLDRSKNKGVTR